MSMQRLDSLERAGLALDRAEVWRGGLLPEEFAARNSMLYAHPFGRERMRTFGLRKDSVFAASLDAVQITLLVRDQKGEIHTTEAWHLASVLTLPAFRRQGLASELINSYLTEERPAWCTLFSGIGPSFYEPFGFSPSPAWQCSRASEAAFSLAHRSLSLEVFTDRLKEARSKVLTAQTAPTAVFFPDVLWWDWVAALYQYFGQVRGQSLPRGRFWELETAEGLVWAAGMENPVSDSWDLWWVSRESEEVLRFFAGQAGQASSKKLSWWSSKPGGTESKLAYPMLRAPTPTPLMEVQLGDWW